MRDRRVRGDFTTTTTVVSAESVRVDVVRRVPRVEETAAASFRVFFPPPCRLGRDRPKARRTPSERNRVSGRRWSAGFTEITSRATTQKRNALALNAISRDRYRPKCAHFPSVASRTKTLLYNNE